MTMFEGRIRENCGEKQFARGEKWCYWFAETTSLTIITYCLDTGIFSSI